MVTEWSFTPGKIFLFQLGASCPRGFVQIGRVHGDNRRFFSHLFGFTFKASPRK